MTMADALRVIAHTAGDEPVSAEIFASAWALARKGDGMDKGLQEAFLEALDAVNEALHAVQVARRHPLCGGIAREEAAAAWSRINEASQNLWWVLDRERQEAERERLEHMAECHRDAEILAKEADHVAE